MTDSEYIEQRLDPEIRWYDRKSISHKRWFISLSLGQLATASAIPVLSILSSAPQAQAITVLIAALGALTAGASGVASLLKFHENWLSYRGTCETLRKERYMYLTRSGAYSGQEQALALLVDRVESFISKEHTNWAQLMGTTHKEATGGN